MLDIEVLGIVEDGDILAVASGCSRSGWRRIFIVG